MNNIVEKEIDGVLYKARYMGVSYALDLFDRVENDLSSVHISEILFREVLVSPKIDIDDFADMETFLKVRAFLLDAVNGGKKLSKAKLKRRARDNWALWRLVFGSEGAISFQTAFGRNYMTPNDIVEANFALDMVNEQRRKAMRKK